MFIASKCEAYILIHLGLISLFKEGYAVAELVEALCYKPEGRGFDSRWCR